MDEIIDEIIADLAAGLIDASDEEINSKLDTYDLTPEDREEVLATIKEVRDAEKLADENPDPLSLENADALADANTRPDDQAQQMADEDNTPVEVTSEDTDGDGDADKTTIEKVNPEDDDELSEEEEAAIKADIDALDDGNSDEADDKPHDTIVSDERMKNIIGTLSQFKY